MFVVVKYDESSGDSSDDEPLAPMKRKLTKAPKDSSSGDEDVPLVNLAAKKKEPVKKNTKKKTAAQGRGSTKRRGIVAGIMT